MASRQRCGGSTTACGTASRLASLSDRGVLGGAYFQYKLDLNHDGVTDLTISNTYSNDVVRWFSSVLARPASANEVEGSGRDASALQRGAQVGGRNHFRAGGSLMAGVLFTYSHSQSRRYGKWLNVHGRYLGIMFQIKGKSHCGWARLNVAESRSRFTVVLTGYAFETIPNKPIIAGATKGPDDSEPTASLLIVEHVGGHLQAAMRHFVAKK
jgi:hypothetical protein